MSDQDDVIDNDSDLSGEPELEGELQPKVDIPNINYLLIMLMTAGNLVLAYTLFKSNVFSFNKIIGIAAVIELLIIILIRPSKGRSK